MKTPMPFIFFPEMHADGSGTYQWFSGRYKITRYEAYETQDTISKEKYAAYYKPDGWVNWGMCVEQATKFYYSLEEAQAACARHAVRSAQDMERAESEG